MLFRSLSGALPPWAIEGIPGLFASLFAAFGRDGRTFCRVVTLSLDVRAPEGFGGGGPGGKLAGPLLDAMSDRAREEFLAKRRRGVERLKTAVKKLCGGKKKASNFSLKPSCTRWDCDRLRKASGVNFCPDLLFFPSEGWHT